MNIMVLGASGYLGRKICNYLEEAGNYIVRVMQKKLMRMESKKREQYMQILQQ